MALAVVAICTAVPWRYTGEWADGHSVTSSTYKIGLRYYDPMLHRWTQPDSPAESMPYNYVGCNPTNHTNHTDPTGAAGCIESAYLLGAGALGVGAGIYGMTTAVGAEVPTPGGSVLWGLPSAGVFLVGVSTIPFGMRDVSENYF